MLTKYDADRAPDPARWLAEDELQRMDIIQRYHRRERVQLDRPELHATVHLIVENQTALGEQPVIEAIARLMGEGLTRHEAIHAVGSVLMDHLNQAMRAMIELDEEAYYRDVRALTRESWYADYGPEKDDDA